MADQRNKTIMWLVACLIVMVCALIASWVHIANQRRHFIQEDADMAKDTSDLIKKGHAGFVAEINDFVVKSKTNGVSWFAWRQVRQTARGQLHFRNQPITKP